MSEAATISDIEFLDRIVPNMDGEVAKAFQRILEKQGLTFRLGTSVTGARVGNEGVTLTLQPARGGETQEIQADVVLLAIGRRAYTGALGAAEAGVALDERGRVKTDGHYATNVPGIYAIGDVIAGPMLAHKAEARYRSRRPDDAAGAIAPAGAGPASGDGSATAGSACYWRARAFG